MKNAPTLHRIEYALFGLVRRLLHALPHEAARPIGRVLGDLTWALLGSRRRVAIANVELALPEIVPASRRRIARESFRHLGRMTCDTVSSYRFSREELCRRMTIEGWEHLEAARSSNRGVVVMSAHLGSWEMAAYPIGLYLEPLHVIGRPLDNPLLDRHLGELRRRFDNATIPKRGAARGSLRVLRAGGIVGILIDQRVRPEQGILVPFFAHPARTSPLLAHLALKTGAPIVPLFGHLTPGGNYLIRFHPPIDVDCDEEDAVAEITRRCLARVEERIREEPETWLWLHRRWKT